MPSAAILRPNKLRVGYPPQRVFGGRGRGGLGKFGPGVHPVARCQALDLGSEGSRTGQGGGASASSPSMLGYQALSGIWPGAVAWAPSHGVAGSADFRALGLPCRLIASVWTGPAGRADRRRRFAAAPAQAGGVPPLSPRAPVPNGPFGREAGNLASSVAPLSAFSALRFGSTSRDLGHARKFPVRPKGSGVWTARKAHVSGATKRGDQRFAARKVGVNRGAHISLDLGRATMLGAGL